MITYKRKGECFVISDIFHVDSFMWIIYYLRIKLSRSVQVVVVSRQSSFLQLSRLVLRQHAQRAAHLESKSVHLEYEW